MEVKDELAARTRQLASSFASSPLMQGVVAGALGATSAYPEVAINAVATVGSAALAALNTGVFRHVLTNETADRHAEPYQVARSFMV